MVDFSSQKGFSCMLHVTEMQVRLFTFIRQLIKLTVSLLHDKLLSHVVNCYQCFCYIFQVVYPCILVASDHIHRNYHFGEHLLGKQRHKRLSQ